MTILNFFKKIAHPILPLEVRANIYNQLDNFDIAKYTPEIFWAIAPKKLRWLMIGNTYTDSYDALLNDLLSIYPQSCRLIEELTIVTDTVDTQIVVDILTDFPEDCKLKHLCLKNTFQPDSRNSLSDFLYEALLPSLALSSPNLSWLTFDHILPSTSLITSCEDLTQLDIGYLFGQSISDTFNIPLPPRLQILTITPSGCSIFSPYHHPPNLDVLILKSEGVSGNTFITDECVNFIKSCETVSRLAVEDSGMFFLTV